MYLGRSITVNSVILAVFALCTAAILAGTFHFTYDRIEDSKRRAAERALLELVPKRRHDNDMLSDVINIPVQELANLGFTHTNGSTSRQIHVARMQGTTVAYIYPAVATDGYSGDIEMIVGVNKDGSIAGVRVLAHKETPGLGDKIDLKKDGWILGFNNKSLTNPEAAGWKVKKDGGEFDQFTGATITPRAVVNRVKYTLDYHQKRMTAHESNSETRR